MFIVSINNKVTQLQEFWRDLVGRIYFVDNLGESSNQIIVRLSEPNVKLRILRCGRNLKKNENYKSVNVNEDLTRENTRFVISVMMLAFTASVFFVFLGLIF
jgi:hypothetical protein